MCFLPVAREILPQNRFKTNIQTPKYQSIIAVFKYSFKYSYSAYQYTENQYLNIYTSGTFSTSTVYYICACLGHALWQPTRWINFVFVVFIAITCVLIEYRIFLFWRCWNNSGTCWTRRSGEHRCSPAGSRTSYTARTLSRNSDIPTCYFCFIPCSVSTAACCSLSSFGRPRTLPASMSSSGTHWRRPSRSPPRPVSTLWQSTTRWSVDEMRRGIETTTCCFQVLLTFIFVRNEPRNILISCKTAAVFCGRLIKIFCHRPRGLPPVNSARKSNSKSLCSLACISRLFHDIFLFSDGDI